MICTWDNASRKAAESQLQPIVNQIRQAKSITELDNITKEYSGIYTFQNYLVGKPSLKADDAKSYAFSLRQGKTALPALAYYADDAALKPAHDALKRLFAARLKYIGETENLEARAEALFAFDKGMAEHMLPPEQLNNPKVASTVANWADANNAIQNIPNSVLPNYLRPTAEQLTLYVPSMDFVKYVGTQFSDKNLGVIKDLYILQLYLNVMDYISDDYVHLSDEFVTVLNGSLPEELPMETRGMQFVTHIFKMQTSELYAKQFGSKELKEDMSQLIELVRAKMIQRVEKNDWLSPATKAIAADKLKSIKTYVAYSDEPLKYTKFDVPEKSKGTLIDVYINKEKASMKESLEELKKPADNDTNLWNALESYTTNAFYYPNYNAIFVPTGFLQSAMYKPGDFENNLGRIGFVIAHELTHSIDTTGAQYDKNGNMSNWWTDEDLKKFNTLTDNISNQLSQIDFAGQKVNGSLVIGETVADLGAFECIMDMADDDPKTDQQKVVSAHAFNWAAKMPLQIAQYLGNTDTHLHHKLRVNYVVQQNDHFYKLFDIHENDPMYVAPERRVHVW